MKNNLKGFTKEATSVKEILWEYLMNGYINHLKGLRSNNDVWWTSNEPVDWEKLSQELNIPGALVHPVETFITDTADLYWDEDEEKCRILGQLLDENDLALIFNSLEPQFIEEMNKVLESPPFSEKEEEDDDDWAPPFQPQKTRRQEIDEAKRMLDLQTHNQIKLLRLAMTLDEKGFSKEAGTLDQIVKEASCPYCGDPAGYQGFNRVDCPSCGGRAKGRSQEPEPPRYALTDTEETIGKYRTLEEVEQAKRDYINKAAEEAYYTYDEEDPLFEGYLSEGHLRDYLDDILEIVDLDTLYSG